MSSQILALITSPELRHVLESECKGLTGFGPVIHDNLDDLDSTLSILLSSDVLVMERPSDEKKSANFLQKITSGKYQIRNVILVGWQYRELNHARSISFAALDLLGENLKECLKTVGPIGWAKLPLHALYHFKQLPFDLFLKVSEDKYIKRIPADETVEAETIQSFHNRGIEELYFERQHIKDFSRLLISTLMQKAQVEHEDIDRQLKARGEVFLTVKDIVQGMGLNPKVVSVCETLMSGMIMELSRSKDDFALYVDRLKNNPDLTFHHRFVELTCFIGGQLIFAMQELDRQEQLKRYVYAAFFCDITQSKPEFIHCMSAEGLEKLALNDRAEVEEHALWAANMINKNKTIPPEVSTIIQQHHGSMGGVGFPLKKASSLVPLAKCLIISQELAYALLMDSQTPAMEVLKNISKKNSKSSLSELIKVLEQNLGQKTL